MCAHDCIVSNPPNALTLHLAALNAGSASGGSWDSIHVFEAAERGRQAHYKLTSTIMLSMVHRGSKARADDKIEAKRDGETTLSGSMTRQARLLIVSLAVSERLMYDVSGAIQSEQDHPLQEQTSHITNVGRMIEDMEIKMRNLLQEVRPIFLTCASCTQYARVCRQVYFGKTRDVVFDLRSLEDLEKARRQRELQKELVGFIRR